MSVEQDIFLIGVIGSRKNITRMLNAAIRNVSGGDPIVESDGIEAINIKLNYFTGRDGHNIGIFDLLDEECMKDEVVIKKKEAAPADPNRYIEVVGVEEGEKDYTAKFSWYLYECYGPTDWADWEDIARLYDCSVFLDDDEYYNGAFWRFCGATVYVPEKGGVSKKHIEPKLDLEGYKNIYDELIELNPERYRAKKIHDFEDKITRMQNEVYRDKIDAILSHSEGSDVIDVPGDIVRIPSYAFNGKGFLWASLHEGTLSIGENAFLDCSSLTLISLPSTLREIGPGAFKGCQSLMKIVLPASLEALGGDAFKGCGFNSIKVQSGNKYWYSKCNCLLDKKDGTLLLGCKKSVIPKGTTAIADGAFWGCAGLKNIVIPSGVLRIGEHAFRDCTGLKRVVIPGTVTCISGWSFMGCTSLEEVVIEDGVEIIDNAAFKNCASLETIVIPQSVKHISAARFGGGAFEGCTSLVSVNLPDGVSIDEGAFKDCPCEKEVMKKRKKQ